MYVCSSQKKLFHLFKNLYTHNVYTKFQGIPNGHGHERRETKLIWLENRLGSITLHTQVPSGVIRQTPAHGIGNYV